MSRPKISELLLKRLIGMDLAKEGMYVERVRQDPENKWSWQLRDANGAHADVGSFNTMTECVKCKKLERGIRTMSGLYLDAVN